MQLLAELQAELDILAGSGLRRRRRLLQSSQSANPVIDGERILSFCSNDYLGLANHPALVEALKKGADHAGVGSGASHLITGHHQYHQAVEITLAQFAGAPAALLFTDGYMANLGVISALLGREDAIFADKLNHASLNDAAVLSRAKLYRFAHNDVESLERLLQRSNAKRKLVAVDAVFSMDGDIAPIPQLLALCERYDAYLMLDDAHGFGVLGTKGKGTLSHFKVSSPRIIYMATLGKAAGVSGAFIAGEQVIVDYLQQKARTYIYTTASPPALSAALLESIKIIEQADERRSHLQHLMRLLKKQLQLGKWRLAESDTAIQPLMVGSNEDVLALSEYLLTLGILVPAIRPPTVPKDTSRLRISLSATHTVDDVYRLVQALHDAEKHLASSS